MSFGLMKSSRFDDIKSNVPGPGQYEIKKLETKGNLFRAVLASNAKRFNCDFTNNKKSKISAITDEQYNALNNWKDERTRLINRTVYLEKLLLKFNNNEITKTPSKKTKSDIERDLEETREALDQWHQENAELQIEETKQQVKFRLSIPPEIEAEEEGKVEDDDLLSPKENEDFSELQAEIFSLKLETSNIQMKYDELVSELSTANTNMHKTNALISLLVESIQNEDDVEFLFNEESEEIDSIQNIKFIRNVFVNQQQMLRKEEAEVNSYKESLSAVTFDNREKEKVLFDLNEKLQASNNECKKLASFNNALNEEIENKSKESQLSLEEKEAQILNLMEAKNTKSEIISSQAAEIVESRCRINQLNEKVLYLSAEKEIYIKESMDQSSQFNKEVGLLKDQLKILSKDLIGANEKFEVLDKKHRDLNLEFSSLNLTNQERAVEFKSREVCFNKSLTLKSQEIEKLIEKVNSLEEELQTGYKENSNLKLLLNDKESEVESLSEKLKGLEAEFATLSNQLSEVLRINSFKDNEALSFDSLLTAKESEIAELSAHFEETERLLNSKVTNLEEQLIESLNNNSINDSDISQLKLKLEDAKSELHRAEQKYSFQSMITETQLKAKSEVVNDLQSDLDITKSQLIDIKIEASNLSELNKTLQTELNAVNSQFKATRYELIGTESRLETNISDLKQQLSIKNDNELFLAASNRDLMSQNLNLRTKISERSTENDNLSDSNSHLVKENNKLMAKIIVTENKMKEMTNSSQDTSQLQFRLNQLNEKCINLQAESEYLKEENQRLVNSYADKERDYKFTIDSLRNDNTLESLDIVSLANNCDEYMQKNEDLTLNLSLMEIAASKLREENAELKISVEEAKYKKPVLVLEERKSLNNNNGGHQNSKQKIHYIQVLKEENEKLRKGNVILHNELKLANVSLKMKYRARRETLNKENELVDIRPL